VNIVPQDIGRVLLNLINNAFYACGNSEYRMKNPELKPTVTVSTKSQGKKFKFLFQTTAPEFLMKSKKKSSNLSSPPSRPGRGLVWV
jgi:two-component system, NtrC family, sensor kinase